MPRKDAGLTLIECKAGRSVVPAMAGPLEKLRNAVRKKRPRAPVRAFVVHQGTSSAMQSRALFPGTSALPWTELIAEL